MRRKRLVALTGAGVSAESGLRTFRDADGLWEEYPLEEVATPQAWARDHRKVLHFYDLRRQQVLAAAPNPAHFALVKLQEFFHVDVVTQNIDDLHERAGSQHVLHLHGEILKARSTVDPELIIPWREACLKSGSLCPKGSQLRPHIVWFGEEVPMMPVAMDLVLQADVLLIIGTSLNVYPAAGLIHYTDPSCDVYVVDPDPSLRVDKTGVKHIKSTASEGVPMLAEQLITTERSA